MNEGIKIWKQIGLLALLVAGLGTIGTAINYLLPWYYLAEVFAFARKMLMYNDFIWDIDGSLGLYFWIGLEAAVWLAVWAYLGYLIVVGKLHK